MKIKNLKPQSTFRKLSLAFLLVGVLPMILVCAIFMRSYEATARRTVESNMAEAVYFAHSKTAQLIESIDSAMSGLYDYSASGYDALWEVLEDDSLNENDRQMYMSIMLDNVMRADPAVSATHFVSPDGTTYSRFYSQQKSLRYAPSLRHRLPDTLNDPRQLCILPAANEGDWCNGSNDRVITLARSYMDTRSLHAVTSRSLGTLYVDLRTEDLDELLAALQLGRQGNAAIVEASTGQAVYLLRPDGEVPLPTEFSSEGGSVSDERCTAFYLPIGTSDYHLMLSFDRQELYSINSANRTYLVFILIVAVAVILTISLLFSGRISTPARQLKQAMEAVQAGDLNARVEIRSGDEMEYLGEGFNRMADTLQDTIEEVYVAQICQRDAELSALKMQIQPHYLYNTLDVIRMSALEQEDPKTARLIESLSHQLRYVMGTHRDRVTLRQELDSLQMYAVLMEARYEGRIRIRMEVPDSALGLYVPKLLLQPFVENAIKHGLRDKPEGGTILIEAVHLPDSLQIMVFNDGIPIDAARLAHIRDFLETSAVGRQDRTGVVSVGMKNTYDRIKFNCGREYGFTLHSDDTAGVVVTIHLPLWKEDEHRVESASGR